LEELVGEIVGGVRSPGEPLPSEAVLAEQFGISRGITREVMRALEERGLVSVRHGSGSTVAARDAWDSLDPLVLAALVASDAGPAVLLEFLEARRLIEVEAAGLAAERATDDDLVLLDEAFAALEDAARRAAATPAAEPRYLEADVNYHQVVMGITHNAVLCSLIGRIHAALLEVRAPTARPDLRVRRTLPEHAKIRNAIHARDPELARQAMSEHLDSVGEHLAVWTKRQRKGRRKAA
jgi:GntR family transcriptional repressor for pyruvate dehydrogenase complex